MKRMMLMTAALLAGLTLSAQNELRMLVGTYTEKTSAEGVYLYKFNQETAEFALLDTARCENPSFVIPSEESVATGDALFQGSIGRTDLPGGNYQALISNLKEKILTLPDNYLVLPGHGEHSTIGDEKKYNSFLT